MSVRLPPEVIRQLGRAPDSAISHHAGCSASTIRRARQSRRIPPHGPEAYTRLDEALRVILTLPNVVWSAQSLAAHLGVGGRSARRYLRELYQTGRVVQVGDQRHRWRAASA